MLKSARVVLSNDVMSARGVFCVPIGPCSSDGMAAKPTLYVW